jgi:hypothetical protein
MFGWLVAALVLFALLPARRAVIAGVIFAWLFLPVATYNLNFIPDFNKEHATIYGLILGILIFDPNRLFHYKPKWIDLFILIFIFVHVPTSIVNGLGPYDGLTQAFNRLLRWGVPFFIGRLYFSDVRAMRDLISWVVLGGLIYMPLCLYEVRMSPQLHRFFYGYYPQSFAQAIRYGGFRPMVFMEHGLMVGMWMAVATLCALGLWRLCHVRTFYRMPMGLIVAALFVTTILCKSTGASLLLIIGSVIILSAGWMRPHYAIIGLALLCVGFVSLRASGIWSGQGLVPVVETVLSSDRAGSLQYRLDHEKMLLEKAQAQPILGWGGWGRSRVFSDSGEDIATSDSMWIIIFGANGLVGLFGAIGGILAPVFMLPRKIRPRFWSHPGLAPAMIIALILTLWMIDNLFNDMPQPVFFVMMGGLAGMGRVVLARRVQRRQEEPEEEAPLSQPAYRGT